MRFTTQSFREWTHPSVANIEGQLHAPGNFEGGEFCFWVWKTCKLYVVGSPDTIHRPRELIYTQTEGVNSAQQTRDTTTETWTAFGNFTQHASKEWSPHGRWSFTEVFHCIHTIGRKQLHVQNLTQLLVNIGRMGKTKNSTCLSPGRADVHQRKGQ